MFFIPKNLLSWLTGQFAAMPWPSPLKGWILRRFASHYNLNLQEAEKPIDDYLSVNDLFTRRLKSGVRPIEGDWVHPADSRLSQVCSIEKGVLLQAKGITYGVNDFLKNDKAEQMFQGGTALTYYLCPTDYHRVHSPCAAQVSEVNYIPGRLWPVNDWSVSHIPQLFSINERVVFWLNTQWGEVAYVMVGATNVGKITLSFDQEIVSNIHPIFPRPQVKTYSPTIDLAPGSEMGTFHLGSTVIVLYPKGAPLEAGRLPLGKPVRMGENIYKGHVQ